VVWRPGWSGTACRNPYCEHRFRLRQAGTSDSRHLRQPAPSTAGTLDLGIVAYPPGCATDLIARALARQLSGMWGKNVLVDTRAGASGMLGAEAVARANPDGYTLLLGYAPEVVLNKLLFSKMPHDSTADRADRGGAAGSRHGSEVRQHRVPATAE